MRREAPCMSKFLYTHRLFVSALQLLCCRTLRVRYSSPPSPFVHTEELCRPSSYHIDILCITYRREKLCKEQGERRNGAYYSDILFFFLVVSPSSLFCVYEHKQNRFSIFGMSHHTVRLWTVCLVTLY